MMGFLRKIEVKFDEHSQSVLLVFLFLIGGVGLILGGMSLRSSLQRPFLLSVPTASETLATTVAITDTDGDGLRDDDELTYGTSPYLTDSDSDGVNDADEVAAGTDPNCPVGKTCQAVAEADVVGAGGDLFSSALQVSGTASAEPTVVQLRAALLSSGISEVEIAKLSDDELLVAYREVAKKQAPAVSANDAVANLSVDTLRKLLREKGITEEQLAKISDEQLLVLYKQTLQQSAAQ